MAALERLSFERLHLWELTKQQRLVAYWIVRLTYGMARRDVWLTGLLLARLTGLHEPDVSTTIGELKRAGVLHVRGTRRRARCFTFLPNAELVMPTPAVEDSQRAAVMAEIEALNRIGEQEEPGGQRLLGVTTVEERLSVEQESASRQLALDSTDARPPTAPQYVNRNTAGRNGPDPGGRSAYEAQRGILERELRRLGWEDAQIDASRGIPLERLLEGARSILGPEFLSESLIENISETLIPRPPPSVDGARISESLIFPTVNSQKTGDCTKEDLSEQSPVTSLGKTTSYCGDVDEPEISESLIQRLKVADPEMMMQLREIVGEKQWSERDPQTGKGNWGSLWNTALRSSQLAPNAARQAIASYKTARMTTVVHRPPQYVWRTFERIHRALIAQHRRQTR